VTDPISVTVVTDGACSGNPGPGGWCAILRYGTQEKVLQGGASLTTNNRMELRAALSALQALTRPCQVEIYTDSQYVRDGITKWIAGWRRNGWHTKSHAPVKNQDLWRALETAQRAHQVNWHWTRGHAGDALNERADRLAVQAIQAYGLRGQPDLEMPDAVVPE
jgi:ribonuclease HI